MNKHYMELTKKMRRENEKLLEIWEPILNHPQMPEINDDWTALNTARLLNNMRKYLKETTFSGDIAQFAPILIPLVRRTLPGLIANELVGMQPMPGPVAQIYALRYGYTGDQKQKEDMTLVGHYASQVRLFTVKKTAFNDSAGSPGQWIDANGNFNRSAMTGTPLAIGDFILASASGISSPAGAPTATGTYTQADGTSQTVLSVDDVQGLWKIIAIEERENEMVFLTTAYPLGTLSEIHEIPNMFPTEIEALCNQGRNTGDYKHYKVKRHIADEFVSLADTTVMAFARATSQVPYDALNSNDPNLQVYDVFVSGLTDITAWDLVDSSPPAADERVLGYMRSYITYGLAEVGYLNVFKEYARPVPTHVGEMMGFRKERRKLGLWVEKMMIEARTRYLQANYSIEAEQDMRAMFQVDINSEFMNILSYEIGQEVDREIIDILFELSMVNGAANPGAHKIFRHQATTLGTNEYDFAASFNPGTGSAGTYGPPRLVDVYRRIMNEIQRQVMEVGIQTQRGNANWALVSPNVGIVLEALQNFNMTNITGDVNATQFGLGYIGTMQGGVKLYKDVLHKRDKDFILLGYKGNEPFDSGIVYAPYIPLQIEQVVNTDTLEREIIFQTRYEIADNIIDAEKYYRLLEFETEALLQV